MNLQFSLAALTIFSAVAGFRDRPLLDPRGEVLSADQVSLVCERSRISWGDRGLMALEGRGSPYDSLSLSVGDAPAKVCYGRPSARERQIFGGLIPYDTLWRTGANEPTTIHLSFSAEIAGLPVSPGAYTLYSVPRRDSWDIILNRSTSQWGLESDYTSEVRAQEVGRATVSTRRAPAFVETFTISAQPTGMNSSELLLEWENTRVVIPIVRVTSP